ncbi:MAG: hypothetical protein C4331_10395 [Meiothermus sp.]
MHVPNTVFDAKKIGSGSQSQKQPPDIAGFSALIPSSSLMQLPPSRREDPPRSPKVKCGTKIWAMGRGYMPHHFPRTLTTDPCIGDRLTF